MTVEEFERHFRSAFAAFVGSKIVVALSGGADSVALLHLLHRSDLGLELIGAHVHHGTRGSEAEDDAAFCERLCLELDIPFALHHLPPLSPGPEGRESTWRRARYTALNEVASRWGADAVATGHQRDDIAEGVLVQLLRGAGPRAMAGIECTRDNLIRPLLAWSHDDLCRWLTDQDMTWREDSSNSSPNHLRNRVRHEVLPMLEAVSPAVRRHLVHLAKTLAEDESSLGGQVTRRAQWIDPWHPDGGVPIQSVVSLDPALRLRWLHAQAEKAGIGRVTRRQGELLTLLLAAEVRAVTLAGRWVLRRASGRLWLEPPREPPWFELDLEPGRRAALPIPGWTAYYGPAAQTTATSGWRFPCKPAQNLCLRSSRAGDRLADGVVVRAALKRTLPRHLRGSWPMLCSGAKILWIPGVGDDTGSSGSEWIVEVMRT